MSDALLRIHDLRIGFRTDDGLVPAVRGVNIDVRPGEVVGIVGESGSGKSVTAMSTLGLLPRNAVIESGSIRFRDQELLGMSFKNLRRVKGKEISVVFQDPMSSLNPVLSIGWQLREAIQAHSRMSRRDANAAARDLLVSVGITEPDRRLTQFPHEFSGGMRQRVMIAIAMANRPALVIADEPTTALDVTVQAQVMRVLTDAEVRAGAAMLLITHDLGLVAERADRVFVMYDGEVVEHGDVRDIFYRPQHSYTKSLLASLPRLYPDQERTFPGAEQHAPTGTEVAE
jgi:ABC-type dipeptide/oligopeptide/nickel transport system ATPase component